MNKIVIQNLYLNQKNLKVRAKEYNKNMILRWVQIHHIHLHID